MIYLSERYVKDVSTIFALSGEVAPRKKVPKGPPPGGALFGPFSGVPGTAALRFSPISPTCSIAKVLGGGPRDPPGI